MKWRRKNPKNKLLGFLILFLIFCFLFLYVADTQFAPVLKALAQQKAYMFTVRKMQEAAQRQIENYKDIQDYQQLMHIEKDSSGKIILMLPNVVKINLLASAIILDAEAALKEPGQDELKIPLGVLSGTKILASLGPSLNIQVTPISLMQVEVRDEFISAGINQTKHRIWLEMKSEVSLAIPFDSEKLTASSSILLSEGIIIGPIPDTYINFSP